MRSGRRIWISTAALLAAATAAVLFAWLGVARKDEATRATKDADARLYVFTPAKVRSVTVEARGDVTRVVRSGDGWRVEAPLAADAERAAVDAVVDRVAELRRKAAIASAPGPEDLARFGLVRPRAKVSLTLDDGKVESLELGDENAFDGTAFVRTTGGAIELVAGDLKWAVDRSTFDLREKALLRFDETDVQRVEIATPALSYALVREGDGWRLVAPVQDRADDATVRRVLGALRGLRATAFAAGGSRATADHPRWTVTLTRADGSRTSLRIAPAASPDKGAPAPLRARLDGSTEVATLPPGSTRELEQDVTALRAKPPQPPDAGVAPSPAADGGPGLGLK